MASLYGHGTDSVEGQEQEIVGSKDFEKLNMLGEGSFGTVSLVVKCNGRDAGALYANKEMCKKKVLTKHNRLRYALTEREILESVRGYVFLAQLHYSFQTNTNLHFIMEFVNGGQLRDHLNRHDYFEENEVRFYTGEITLALESLHALNIIYRDLKPENVLLDAQGHIVLADFGLSRKFQPFHPTKKTYSFCGTPTFMSPEVIQGTGHSFTTDWFSLGAMMWELLTGNSPFLSENRSTEGTLKRILQGTEDLEYPDFISLKCKDFMKKLLCMDPACRLGAGGPQEVKSHPFLKTMNWEKLMLKEVLPPFLPGIVHPLDLSNFNKDFVNASIRESESDSPGIAMDFFKGFEYSAPWALSGCK